MTAAVSKQALSIPMPENMKNILRARILKSMLITAAQAKETPKASNQQSNETENSPRAD